MSQFRARADELRPGLATGKYDAYLLMPRGVRDEEFHTAVTELLSDWGSAAPVVPRCRSSPPSSTPSPWPCATSPTRWACPPRWSRPTPRPAARCSARYGDGSRSPVVSALGDVPRSPARCATSRSPSTALPTNRRRQGRRPRRGRGRAGRPRGRRLRLLGGAQTVVLESDAIGGQAGTSSMIRNYLGFPRGISGMRLSQRARNQAIRFGTRFFTGWPVDSLDPGVDGEPHRVVTGGGDVRPARWWSPPASPTVGSASPRSRSSSGSACTTAPRSAPRARWRTATSSWSVAATRPGRPPAPRRYARSVTLLVRRPDVSATMSDYLIREMQYSPRITVRECAEVVDGGGDGPPRVDRGPRPEHR